MQVCHSCAANSGETAFPATFKRGKPRLCLDCIARIALDAEAREQRFVRASKISRTDWRVAPIVRRRASYRAALRHRAQSPQLDLVDFLMARP